MLLFPPFLSCVITSSHQHQCKSPGITVPSTSTLGWKNLSCSGLASCTWRLQRRKGLKAYMDLSVYLPVYISEALGHCRFLGLWSTVDQALTLPLSHLLLGWVTSCQTQPLVPWHGSSWLKLYEVFGQPPRCFMWVVGVVNSTCCTLASAHGVAAVNLHIWL